MADKSIASLPSANEVGITDLLLIDQSGTAKSVTGQKLINQLLAQVNDHGGIQGITFATSTIGIFMNIIARDGTQWSSPNLRGNNGATGASASITSTEYQASASGTEAPTGTWTTTIPTVLAGQFLWIKWTWNNGNVSYIATRQGVDGSGAVSSVNGQVGNVVLTASNIGTYGVASLGSDGKVLASQLPVWDGSVS